MTRVCFAFLIAAACTSIARAAGAPVPDTPPAGIEPAGVPLSQVLKAYDAAAGALLPGVANTRVEHWTYTDAGLKGSETLVRSGQDYYARVLEGAYVEEFGRFIGKGWHRDRNGVVSEMSSIDYGSLAMLVFVQGLHDAQDPKNDAKVLGQVAAPCVCYVVSVKYPGDRHPEYVYYDKSSGLVDRTEHVIDDTKITTDYADYRTTKGLVEPWHVHVSTGDALRDTDFQRADATLGVSVDPVQFAPPHSTYGFASYSGALTLPIKVLWDDNFLKFDGQSAYSVYRAPNVVVRMVINGRGLDFALACGKARSYIDWDVAQQLGLTSQNQNIRDKNGDPISFETLIPQASIGGLTLSNFAVRAVPFHYHLGNETKIVGVLGYDLLSSGVFTVDFVNEKLTLAPAAQFDGPIVDPKALVLPLTFDDGLPYTVTAISGHPSTRMLVDNDFDYSVIFGSFLDRYPDAVQDVNGKAHADATLPFADAHSYGSDAQVWQAVLPRFDFAGAHFLNFRMIADSDNAAADDTDAVVGGDVLRFYDMTFDYAHARVILKPNAWFYKVYKVEPQ